MNINKLNKKILIADDDINIIASLKFVLAEEGFDILAVTTPHAVLDNLEKQEVDLVLLDMNFHQDTTSGAEGIKLVEDVQAFDSRLPVIVMTGWATVDIAVEAMQAGARDFVQKPWKNERIISAIKTQFALAESNKVSQRLSQQNKMLTSQEHPQDKAGIVAESDVMKNLMSTLEELAQSDMSILLTGDNGTGKSMLASYVHNVSRRAEHSFVAVNMGAVPESLFESELFGHTKGAFTDAKESRIGRFEMAQHGTIFLDELANIPLSQQGKLLRVLEEQQYEPVGSSKSLHADVRIISATNGDLPNAILNNEFRQDLYYRLNTIELRVPSLQERREDIAILATQFLTKFSAKYHKACPSLAPSAIKAMQAYTWPGNIRELSHLMERVLFTCKGQQIEDSDLMLNGQAVNDDSLDDPELTLEEIEKKALVKRLKLHQGNASLTAKSLGLSRSGYYRRLSKYELD